MAAKERRMSAKSSSRDLNALTRAELVRLAQAAGIRGATRLKKMELVHRLQNLRGERGETPAAAVPTAQLRAASEADVVRKRCPGGTDRADGAAADASERPVLLERGVSPEDEPRLLSVRPTSRHWCEVRWSVTRNQLRIAEAALGPERHHCSPVLHVERVGTPEERALPRVELVQRIPVDLDEGCWYVRIDRPNECWQVRLGLQSERGRFQPLMHSPRFCPSQALSRAVRLRPGVESPLPVQYSAARTVGAPRGGHGERAQRAEAVWNDGDEFGRPPLSLRLLLTLMGQCAEGCEVCFDGAAVPVAEDGAFEIPLTLRDGREVLPLSVITPDGGTQWTQVFTVELRQQSLTPQRLDASR
ncbi:MAG: DUF4912 domain-containing protein [Planctomycetota bacterium]|nr:MAG: DUF4912 domain-containing protein [Planctomycetota bacterium]